MSFQPGLNPNVNKVRKDMVDYIDNILASGHGSVLEHSVYTFAIEGVSRVFTAEMNRHRAGWAISEGSLRFIRFDKDIPWWMPKSICWSPEDNNAENMELAAKKAETRALFQQAFANQQMIYQRLLEIWNMKEGHYLFSYKKKLTSCFRRIIGMGVATGGVWTGNIRALRHVLTMRGDDAAEEEIFHVFAEKIGPYMLSEENILFGDFSATPTGALVPKYRKV